MQMKVVNIKPGDVNQRCCIQRMTQTYSKKRTTSATNKIVYILPLCRLEIF